METTQCAQALQESRDRCAETGAEPLVREIFTRVGDRWTLQVVQQLAGEPVRFTHLQEAIPGISHRMLTKVLRALERDGLVLRQVYRQVPPRVDYALTRLGRTLIGPVMQLAEWAYDHQADIETSRVAFDESSSAAAQPEVGG